MNATKDADLAAIDAHGVIRTPFVVVANGPYSREVVGCCADRHTAGTVGQIHGDRKPVVYRRGKRQRWIQAR